MLARQRQERILDQVRLSGGARVSDLVELLDVSDMTIRRDIAALAERGLVTRVHGGAVGVRGTTRTDELAGSCVPDHDLARLRGGVDPRDECHDAQPLAPSACSRASWLSRTKP